MKVGDLYMDVVGGVKKQRVYGIGSLGASQTSSGMNVERIKEQGRAEVQKILDEVVAKQGQLDDTVRLLVEHAKASDPSFSRPS